MCFATSTCKCHKCRHLRATSRQPLQTMTCGISDGPGATLSWPHILSALRESGQGSWIICTWWILWGWSCFPLPKPLLASYSPLPPPYQLPSGPRASVGCSEIISISVFKGPPHFDQKTFNKNNLIILGSRALPVCIVNWRVPLSKSGLCRSVSGKLCRWYNQCRGVHLLRSFNGIHFFES